MAKRQRAKDTPSLTVYVDDPGGHYNAALADFKRDAASAGLTAQKLPLAGPPPGGTFPHPTIIIAIDPATLRQIAEYAAALFAAYKSVDYVGEFFKAAAAKLGDAAGGAALSAIGSLLRRVWAHDKSADSSAGPLYFAYELDTASDPAMTVCYLVNIRDLSESEVDQSYRMLMLHVIPLVQLASQYIKAEGIKLQRCQLSLKRDDARTLTWEIDARPISRMSVALDGVVNAQGTTLNNRTVNGIDEASLLEFARTEGRHFRQCLPTLDALIRDLDLKAKYLETLAANPRTRLAENLRPIQAIDDATAKLDRVLDHRLFVDLYVTKQYFVEMRRTGRPQNAQSLATLLSLLENVLVRLRTAFASG